MSKRHIRLRGHFDSATKLQDATLTIEDDNPENIVAALRIKGRHDIVTYTLNPVIEKAYQAEKILKANEGKPKRRYFARRSLTSGR